MNLNMNYWVLELHRLGHLDMVSKYQLTIMNIDWRIIEFVCPSVSSESPSDISFLLESPRETFVCGCHTYKVYWEKLLSHSMFLGKLLDNRQFKPLPGIERGIVRLNEGPPENLQTPNYTIERWILFCYTDRLPLLSLDPNDEMDDLDDLELLAAYFMDNSCLRAIAKRKRHVFLKDFKTHTKMGHDKNVCTLCRAWNIDLPVAFEIDFQTPFAEILVERP